MSITASAEQRPTALVTLLGLTLAAIATGSIAALVGIPALYTLIALSVIVIFAALAERCPGGVICASIVLLGLVPFNWGIQTGVVPKLFGDEALPVLYLLMMPFLYLWQRRQRRCGFSRLYFVLVAFLIVESLSLLPVTHDLVAMRNYIETFALGPMLALLMLQEARPEDVSEIADAIVWVTAGIAALSILEKIVQRNPIMEHVKDVTYLSPLLARITEGVYRPYVTFFHPSETGTFMGLGLPFAARKWMQKRTVVRSMWLLVIAGGLLVNATRGVWSGVMVACVLLIPNALVLVTAVVPVAAAVATVAYLALKDTPFMQRLTDPNNLLSRLESWKLGVRVFADHPVLGVGHMQFREVYLGYVQDLSNVAHFDLTQVYVVDNMYLTVLVEHGMVGLFAMLGLFGFVLVSLRRVRIQLLAGGETARGSFIRATELALVIYAVTGCFADVNLFTKATKYLFILIGLGFAMARTEEPNLLQPSPAASQHGNAQGRRLSQLA